MTRTSVDSHYNRVAFSLQEGEHLDKQPGHFQIGWFVIIANPFSYLTIPFSQFNQLNKMAQPCTQFEVGKVYYRVRLGGGYGEEYLCQCKLETKCTETVYKPDFEGDPLPMKRITKPDSFVMRTRDGSRMNSGHNEGYNFYLPSPDSERATKEYAAKFEEDMLKCEFTQNLERGLRHAKDRREEAIEKAGIAQDALIKALSEMKEAEKEIESLKLALAQPVVKNPDYVL